MRCGLCRHAVSVCVCVCVCVSVTFVSYVKTNKDIFKFFSPSGSHTILVFPYQTGWQYCDGNPPNGGVECRWSRQKSLQQARCCKHGRRWMTATISQVVTLISLVVYCQAPRAIKSPSSWFFSPRATKRYLAL